jgi:hypothetical protein
VARAVLASLEHWQAELAAIQPAAGSDAAKQHLLASLRQAHMSLGQIMRRDSTEN